MNEGKWKRRGKNGLASPVFTFMTGPCPEQEGMRKVFAETGRKLAGSFSMRGSCPHSVQPQRGFPALVRKSGAFPAWRFYVRSPFNVTSGFPEKWFTFERARARDCITWDG